MLKLEKMQCLIGQASSVCEYFVSCYLFLLFCLVFLFMSVFLSSVALMKPALSTQFSKLNSNYDTNNDSFISQSSRDGDPPYNISDVVVRENGKYSFRSRASPQSIICSNCGSHSPPLVSLYCFNCGGQLSNKHALDTAANSLDTKKRLRVEEEASTDETSSISSIFKRFCEAKERRESVPPEASDRNQFEENQNDRLGDMDDEF
jgi:hypothetical protein